ncbi:MAG TPA: DUF2249 domain-containing protein, partial [Chloroflexota bacterium]|nr:DUF2249 domain-containing protein [Chloroflexota bacterium]
LVIADHDTKAVFYMYQSESPYSLDWQYVETGPDVWKVRVRKEARRPEASNRDTFDVREMPPAQRHAAILARFDGLSGGEGFVLVNDHDPRPLYYQIRAMRGEIFEWTYLASGPRVWEISIVKTREVAAEPVATAAKVDVREIPPAERHHTIFHLFGTLPDEEAMEVIADHDPRPLYYSFQRTHGERFSWSYLEQGPDVWRVLITRHGSPEHRRQGQAQGAARASELDVRQYPPAERHAMIDKTFDDLKPDEAFILVNDHDPKPIYYQYSAEQPGRFTWEYLEQGPEAWKVRIGKIA